MKTHGWLLLIFLIACAPAADEKIGLDIAVAEINAAVGIKYSFAVFHDGKIEHLE